MLWRLRRLPGCHTVGCDRPPTNELYNDENSISAYFCGRHALEALRHARSEAWRVEQWEAGAKP